MLRTWLQNSWPFPVVLAFVLSVATPLRVVAQGPSVDKLIEPGFVRLFNGKDLAGWRVDDKADKSVWQVDDHAIMHIGKHDQKSSHLWTETTYTNFGLLIDWKFDGKGTTGVYYGSRGILQIKTWDATKDEPPASEGSSSLG